MYALLRPTLRQPFRLTNPSLAFCLLFAASFLNGSHVPAHAQSGVNPYLYVSYLGGSTVDVVDPTTFKIVKTISGINAAHGTYGVAESADGTKVYTGRDILYALDSRTGSVLASVSAPVFGLSVATSPDGSRVYGANGYGGYAVYDSNSLSVLHSQGTNAKDLGGGQTLVAVSPDNTLFAVCNGGASFTMPDGDVTIYRTADYSTVATVSVLSASGCVFSKDSHSLYVTSGGYYHYVYVISTGTGAVESTLSVGSSPEDVAISPDGSKVFVDYNNTNFFSVINTTNLTVTNSGYLGSGGGDALACSADGKHLYTGLQNTLVEIDPVTLQVTRSLPMNGNIEGLATAAFY